MRIGFTTTYEGDWLYVYIVYIDKKIFVKSML